MSEQDDILKALDDKEPEKKPSNWELWAALYFAEFVFVVLDAGSALSVWWITGYWYYGLIVFLAGVIPLWLYTKQYTRAYASKTQQKTAFIGGIVAVSSVIVVAVFMAVLNFYAKNNSSDAVMWTESGMAVSLVLILAVHGFINGRYFFSDEAVIENQRTNRMIARADRSVTRIGVANRVARAKRNEVSERKTLEREFSPEVVAKILNLLADDDGDGIPNVVDFVDNRQPGKQPKPQQVYASEEKQVQPKEKPADPTQPPRQ